jgi:hypothetical protein
MAIVDRRGEDDPFTRLLTGPVFHAFDWAVRKVSYLSILTFGRMSKSAKADIENQENRGPDSKNMLSYSDNHIMWVVEIFGTALASLAPMSSIVLLYFVKDMLARLGIVCAFTVVFAAILRVATRARRVEVFAITAAVSLQGSRWTFEMITDM